VPVDGGRDRQVVDKAHPQPFALTHTQLGAGCRGAERPGLGLVPRHQLHVQRCSDQLVVVTRFGFGDFPQPVTVGATGTDAHYGQACKTTQDLSTGKGSGHNNLTYLPQAQGLQRADTIHLHRLNSKASHVGGGLLPIAVCQPPHLWLIHRYRQQAPSHIGSSLFFRAWRPPGSGLSSRPQRP